jgi:hypothetical protein
MTKRLAKYAAVAVLYYVSIMRDQLERDIDLGRLIRSKCSAPSTRFRQEDLKIRA